MKKIIRYLVIFLIGIFAISLLTSCKTKKTVIDKKEIEKEEVVIDEKKDEEKKHSETEKEKKEEKSIIDEDVEIEADKIVIKDPDGTVTEYTNPRIKKKKSEKKESTTDKEKVTETEEDKKTERKEVAKKERKENVSEKHTSKDKTPIWMFLLVIVAGGYLIYSIIKRLRLI